MYISVILIRNIKTFFFSVWYSNDAICISGMIKSYKKKKLSIFPTSFLVFDIFLMSKNCVEETLK